ncbi:MAG: hypothetical protein OHK0039_09200 [Bacteroidia bacterium]
MPYVGDGSSQLAPNDAAGGQPEDVVALFVNSDEYGNFAQWNSSDTLARLYVRLKNPAQEIIYMGFSRARYDYYTDADLYEVEFQLKDPSGNVVFGPQRVRNNRAINRTKARNGPSTIPGTQNGFTPYTYDPPANAPAGDYYIEFKLYEYDPIYHLLIDHWNITVANNSTGTPAPVSGRVWSYNWALFAPHIDADFDRNFNGAFYIQRPSPTGGSFISKIDFDGAEFRPAAFNVSFNPTGTANTGDVSGDRRSVEAAKSMAPAYRIFISDPDPTIWPSATYGQLVSAGDNIRRCGPEDVCFGMVSTQPGQVDLLLDFTQDDDGGTTGRYDPGTRDVFLSATLPDVPNDESQYETCIE